MKRLSILSAAVLTVALFVSACQPPRIFYATLEAQSFPVTKTLVWDPNPASDGVINYVVTQNGTVIGSPTGTTQPVTFNALGTYTFTVAAVNLFFTGPATTFVVTVANPTNPKNPRLQ